MRLRSFRFMSKSRKRPNTAAGPKASGRVTQNLLLCLRLLAGQTLAKQSRRQAGT